MARYTSETAVSMVENRYDLVLIASRRARELSVGYAPTIVSDSGNLVKALEEIEQGKVGRELLLKSTHVEDRRTRKERHSATPGLPGRY
jgi:DNA-directed RNA polymerase subunit omega